MITQGLPPTMAQQAFVIGSGLAGIFMGMMLAKELSGVDQVPSSTVGVATLISVVGTVAAGMYLASKAREG